jgi:tubulin-specific chaperone B
MAYVGSAVDVPLLIKSHNASSERRVSPAWTIAHLRSRLETITGIPVSAQRLQLGSVTVEAADEETTDLSGYGLQPYAELHVSKVLILRCSRSYFCLQ